RATVPSFERTRPGGATESAPVRHLPPDTTSRRSSSGRAARCPEHQPPPHTPGGVARSPFRSDRRPASKGVRLGNWLTVRQAQTLLDAPDATTIKEIGRA